jgi:hypothetical protein
MIIIHHIFKTMQAKVQTWLALFLLLFICKATAQYEKRFNNYNGIVSVLAETYDHALLIEQDPNTPDGPVLLKKYTLEGKTLWTKQFDNTFWVTSATGTSDSGFIVAAVVETQNVDSATYDTTGDIAIVKFDKCAKMQWARYVPAPNYNIPTNIIENKGYFYLVGMGISSWDQNHKKPVTVLKLSNSGLLLSYKFFAGDYALLYNNLNHDTIYLSQDLSLPINGDTGNYYAFSGIQSIDTNINVINKTVFGYQQTFFNTYGPLLTKGI